MAKMELGKSIQIQEGVLQTSFDLRDIHFQDDSLIIHTVQGNIVALPAVSFAAFISAIQSAVKESLIAPAPAKQPKPV